MKQAWLIGILLAAPCGLTAQEDEKGCKDHSVVTRMAGFRIDSCENQEFATGRFTAAGGNMVTIEGKKTLNKYLAKEVARKVSELQIVRNYQEAVKKAGGAILWSDDRGSRTTGRFVADGREIWLSVRAYDQGESYDLLIVEKEAMVQEVTAAQMLTALNKDGRIALNIQFDFGKATIRQESIDIVEQMATLLKENAALKVSVEGHTDNVGSAAANLALSDQRAKSVVAALVQRGIEPARMTAAGFGMSKPLADNSTEEGRAKNRRVELVKR